MPRTRNYHARAPKVMPTKIKLRFRNPKFRSRIPPLPYEIFSIIAEFLAGSCAFGTLANLNVANHMMRMETMPVLYETVLLDNIENLEYYRDWTFTLPLGFKYTKFHFCAETEAEFRNAVNAKSRAIMFPKLVMTVSVNRDTNVDSDDYDSSLHSTNCSIWLEKSITAATAFGVILHTPVHHGERSHEQCPPAAAESCRAERRRRPVRPLQTFTRLCKRSTAHVLPDPQPGLGWTTCVRPRDLRLLYQPLKADMNTQVDLGTSCTVTELMMLATRHRKTIRLTINKSGEAERAIVPGTSCRHIVEPFRWNMRFQMPWAAFGLLIKQYMALVEKHPQLLYNRIIFMFDEQVPQQAMTAMTETLTAFYNKFNDRTCLSPLPASLAEWSNVRSEAVLLVRDPSGRWYQRWESGVQSHHPVSVAPIVEILLTAMSS